MKGVWVRWTARAQICFETGECFASAPSELNIPDFVVIDTKKKTVRTTKASAQNRATAFTGVEIDDRLITLQGVDVALPRTTSKPMPSEKDHLTLTVDSSQQIFINDYKVELEALQDKMMKILEGRPDQKVYLRADSRVPYGVVVP